jgi:peptidoglycan/LPS O-acetylase OafA/YrhL
MLTEVKLDKVLLIRSLSCIVVFFSHIPIWKYINNDNPLYKILVFNGRSAVTIFFILSGYLITKQFLVSKYPLNFDGIKSFWISRIKRIVPTAYLSILFCILLRPDILATQQGSWKIIQGLLFYFDVDLKPEFMNQLWSLSVEMQFYFLIPFLLLVLNKYLKNIKFVIWFGLLTLFGSYLYRKYAISLLEQNSYTNQLRHFGLHFFFLLFGVLTSYFEHLIRNQTISKTC